MSDSAGPVVVERPILQTPSAPEQVPQAAPESLIEAQAAEARPAETNVPETFLWLTRADQLFVGVLVATILVLMAVHWVRLSRWGTMPVEVERLADIELHYHLDINQATWVEWSQLDGIGEALAGRIVEDRQQNGPFRRIEDLQRVKGIGPKTVERIRPWLKDPSAD